MFRFPVISALIIISTSLATAASAQPSAKPKSPAEIAAASQLMTEKYNDCRRQAKEQKLKFLKSRSFIKACVKNAQ
jgi:hypothetical protein